MGFDRAMADVSCDVCGLESEPVELLRSDDGGYGVEDGVKELENNGWRYDRPSDKLACPDCLYNEANPDGCEHDPHGDGQ